MQLILCSDEDYSVTTTPDHLGMSQNPSTLGKPKIAGNPMAVHPLKFGHGLAHSHFDNWMYQCLNHFKPSKLRNTLVAKCVAENGGPLGPSKEPSNFQDKLLHKVLMDTLLMTNFWKPLMTSDSQPEWRTFQKANAFQAGRFQIPKCSSLAVSGSI